MNQQLANYLGRTLVSGTVAGMMTAATAAVTGKRDSASYAAPLNATSHILWGEGAAAQDRVSMKYTMTGFLLTQAATIFWASIYEKLFGRRVEDRYASPLRPLLGAAAVAGGAYITDYYLVPRRFTPGYEKRVSGKSLAMIFGVLALGLAARSLAQRQD